MFAGSASTIIPAHWHQSLLGRGVGDETQQQLTLHDVTQALDGNPQALDRLIDGLTPVVQERVARILMRGASRRPNIRSVVEDLTQEVFFALFDNQGRILKDWAPERGLSLERFVALVAERRVLSVLRRKRRNPWTEEATEQEVLDRRTAAVDLDQQVQGRDQLGHMLQSLKQQLSPLGWHVFELLFVRELSVVEVAEATTLTPDAIYAWRSRLRRLARRLRDGGDP